MKFIKKPVEIEALQWTGENHRDMYNFLGGRDDSYIKVSGDHFYIDNSRIAGGLIIKTLEGEHTASIGDWIIKGVKGEYYPCKPDIFELTYAISEASRPAIEAEVMVELERRLQALMSTRPHWSMQVLPGGSFRLFRNEVRLQPYNKEDLWHQKPGEAQESIDIKARTLSECLDKAEQAQKGGEG